MYGLAKGALYGFDRVVPYTWLEIAGSVVAIVATIAVVASGSHAYLAPLIVGYAVLMVGAAWVLRPRLHEERALGCGRSPRMAGYVGLASVGGLASAGLLQLLPLLAGWFTTAVEASYFVTGVTLVAPLYFLPRALGMALFPEMARAHGAGDVDGVRRHADVSTRALLVLLGAGVRGRHPLGQGRVGPVLRCQVRPGAAVLQVLLAATYLAVIQVAAVNVLSSGTRREVRIPVFSAVAGSLIGLVLLIPLGAWFGSAGVGTAYLVAIGAGAAGPVLAAWRRYDMDWAGPFVRSLAVVAAALILALVVDTLPLAGAVRVLLDLGLALVRRSCRGRAVAPLHPGVCRADPPTRRCHGRRMMTTKLLPVMLVTVQSAVLNWLGENTSVK